MIQFAGIELRFASETYYVCDPLRRDFFMGAGPEGSMGTEAEEERRTGAN